MRISHICLDPHCTHFHFPSAIKWGIQYPNPNSPRIKLPRGRSHQNRGSTLNGVGHVLQNFVGRLNKVWGRGYLNYPSSVSLSVRLSTCSTSFNIKRTMLHHKHYPSIFEGGGHLCYEYAFFRLNFVLWPTFMIMFFRVKNRAVWMASFFYVDFLMTHCNFWSFYWRKLWVLVDSIALQTYLMK